MCDYAPAPFPSATKRDAERGVNRPGVATDRQVVSATELQGVVLVWMPLPEFSTDQRKTSSRKHNHGSRIKVLDNQDRVAVPSRAGDPRGGAGSTEASSLALPRRSLCSRDPRRRRPPPRSASRGAAGSRSVGSPTRGSPPPTPRSRRSPGSTALGSSLTCPPRSIIAVSLFGCLAVLPARLLSQSRATLRRRRCGLDLVLAEE